MSIAGGCLAILARRDVRERVSSLFEGLLSSYLLDRNKDRNRRHAAELCPGPAPGRLGNQCGACRARRARGRRRGKVQDLGVLYVSFSDLGGNGWAVQQLPYRD